MGNGSEEKVVGDLEALAPEFAKVTDFDQWLFPCDRSGRQKKKAHSLNREPSLMLAPQLGWIWALGRVCFLVTGMALRRLSFRAGRKTC